MLDPRLRGDDEDGLDLATPQIVILGLDPRIHPNPPPHCCQTMAGGKRRARYFADLNRIRLRSFRFASVRSGSFSARSGSFAFVGVRFGSLRFVPTQVQLVLSQAYSVPTQVYFSPTQAYSDPIQV
ncbi:MAG: hypothetical protein ACK4Z4_04595 [Ferrovibrio sp.]